MDRLLLWEVPLGPDGGSDGAEFLEDVRKAVSGGDPEAILGTRQSITVPAVVLLGRQAFPIFHDAADSIVATLPDGRRVTVEGADHGWAATDMAGVIASCLRTEE